MKILYSPQVNNERIIYKFGVDVISATYKGVTDTFDFSSLTDGELRIYDDDGNPTIETILEINPIISAKMEDGILSVSILNFIGSDASYEERFPDWVEV